LQTDTDRNSPLGRNVTLCSLRYGVSMHNLCSLPVPGSFFRHLLRRSLGAEFAHSVRCAFELMMIRDSILSVPAWVPLTDEDVLIGHLLT